MRLDKKLGVRVEAAELGRLYTCTFALVTSKSVLYLLEGIGWLHAGKDGWRETYEIDEKEEKEERKKEKVLEVGKQRIIMALSCEASRIQDWNRERITNCEIEQES